MLKIYGAAHSRAFRVIWLANEIGIPYEHVPVSFNVPDAQCKEPWYLALNPNGNLPTIDDDGFVMWETGAINLYLASKYPSPLYPTTPQDHGRMLQWSFFAATEIEPAMLLLLLHRVALPPEQRRADLADQFERTLRIKLAVLEQQLVKTAFLGGDSWKMADFMVACVLYVVRMRLKLDLAAYPRLDAWLTASLDRPAALVARKLRET
jgi:glutathione S-transferase